MNRTSVSTGRVMLIVMSGFLDVSGLCAVHEPVVNERTVIEPDKTGIAETLLDFKIEEFFGHTQPPPDCTTAQKLQNDRRKLDPQLAASNGMNILNPESQAICNEAIPSYQCTRDALCENTRLCVSAHLGSDLSISPGEAYK